MKTNVMCSNCGQHMVPIKVEMYRDDKNGNCFIDVRFSCKDKNCLTDSIMRYSEQQRFCPNDYSVCLQRRELIYTGNAM